MAVSGHQDEVSKDEDYNSFLDDLINRDESFR